MQGGLQGEWGGVRDIRVAGWKGDGGRKAGMEKDRG